MSQKLSRANERLVGHLAAGHTISKAAALAGLSRKTASRRLADPDFRKQVAEARRQLVDRATGKLAGSMSAAAVVLRKLLKSKAENIQLAAARTVLDVGHNLRNETELEERLEVLENAILRKGKP